MKEPLKVAATVLILVLLTISTVLLLDLSFPRLPNGEKRPDSHRTSDYANQTTRHTIPTVDEFAGWDLEGKARYCAEDMPEKSPAQWAQGYLCGAKHTDDEAAISSQRTVILTVALFAVACAQAVIYAVQARTMKGQLIAAQQTAIAALGIELPKLLLHKVEFADMGVADLRARLQYPKVNVTLKNYGRTPAFISQQSLEVECFGIALPPVEYPRSHVVLPGTVADGREVYELGAARPRRLITDDEIDGILSWTRKLAVYGFVAYSDFLGKRHTARFYSEILIHRDGYIWTEGNPPPDYTESL